jgi:hypothetical protein
VGAALFALLGHVLDVVLVLWSVKQKRRKG